jgi:propionyl-CoA synthetase
MSYSNFHRESLEQPQAFWARQAELVDWHAPFEQVHDGSQEPFDRWFAGGKLNLCHNAVDRHLAERAHQDALIWCSTEVDREKRVHCRRWPKAATQATCARSRTRHR